MRCGTPLSFPPAPVSPHRDLAVPHKKIELPTAYPKAMDTRRRSFTPVFIIVGLGVLALGLWGLALISYNRAEDVAPLTLDPEQAVQYTRPPERKFVRTPALAPERDVRLATTLTQDQRPSPTLVSHQSTATALHIPPTWTPYIAPTSTSTVQAPFVDTRRPQHGGKLAYVRGSTNNWQIVIADLQTGQEWNLPNQPNHCGVPSWAPDGIWLAFQCKVKDNWQIFIMRFDGDGLQQLTSEGDNRDPAWSPNGRMIAFVSDRFSDDHQLCVMTSGGTTQAQLTDSGGRKGDPSWSPDSQWLAYEAETHGRLQIFVIQADGSASGERQITTEGYNNSTPAWSPDGRYIAFERQDVSGYHIWIISPDGRTQRQITSGASKDFRPAWSADGLFLVFFSDLEGQYEIWMISVSGKSQPLVVSQQTGFDPALTRP